MSNQLKLNTPDANTKTMREQYYELYHCMCIIWYKHRCICFNLLYILRLRLGYNCMENGRDGMLFSLSICRIF